MNYNASLLEEIANIIGDERVLRQSLWLRITDAMRGQTVKFPSTGRAWRAVAVKKMFREHPECSIRGIARRLGVPKSTVCDLLARSR